MQAKGSSLLLHSNLEHITNVSYQKISLTKRIIVTLSSHSLRNIICGFIVPTNNKTLRTGERVHEEDSDARVRATIDSL